MNNLILFIVYWTFIYFFLYCITMYIMSRKNIEFKEMRFLDFIWKCKADFFNHKKLLALTLLGTAILIRIL